MRLWKTSRHHYNAILIGTVYIAVMQSSMLMAASGEPDRFKAGIAGTSSIDSSILSPQTSRFYEKSSSGESVISADSESSPRISAAPSNALPTARAAQSTVLSGSVTVETPVGLIPPVVPVIAAGHEALYRWFLEGRLEYRPDPTSDDGLITLLFRDLLAPLAGTANPLSATFDLSGCGDAGYYLSINIGYKKDKIPANAGKTEIWICPKFLVEQELETTASYLVPMMGQWESPVGYFWTWGRWDVRSDNYDYLLKGMVAQDTSLYGTYTATTSSAGSMVYFMPPGLENFRLFL